jgi:hypothetical protein
MSKSASQQLVPYLNSAVLAPDAQASPDVLPAIVSVKSVLSVVKKQNRSSTTDRTENTDESQSSQTAVFSEEERSRFSRSGLMRDRHTQPRSWRCPVKKDDILLFISILT